MPKLEPATTIIPDKFIEEWETDNKKKGRFKNGKYKKALIESYNAAFLEEKEEKTTNTTPLEAPKVADEVIDQMNEEIPAEQQIDDKINFESINRAAYAELRKSTLLKKKKAKDYWAEFSEKFPFWLHPANQKATYAFTNYKSTQYALVTRVGSHFLNNIMKWLKWLKAAIPDLKDLSYYAIYDFLTNASEDMFATMYNKFIGPFGSPNPEEQLAFTEKWKHVLPKGRANSRDENGIILARNFRLTIQGNIKSYVNLWRKEFIRNKLLAWNENKNDAGQSAGSDMILNKKELNQILLLLKPTHRILALFMAHTGLRVNDAITGLLSWKPEIYPPDAADRNNQRWFLRNVVSEKRNKLIYILFLSKEFTAAITGLAGTDDLAQIDIQKLLKKKYGSGMLTSTNLQQALANAIKKIRKNNPEFQKGKRIKTHLLRKYFISQLGQSVNITEHIEPDLLEYLSQHQTRDPLFSTYKQYIQNPQIMFSLFTKYLEPAILSQHTIIDRTPEEVKRLGIEMELKNIEMNKMQAQIEDNKSFKAAALETFSKNAELTDLYSKNVKLKAAVRKKREKKKREAAMKPKAATPIIEEVEEEYDIF